MGTMLIFLEFKGVVLDGLVCSSIDNLLISEDTALTADGVSRVHNYYKIDITKVMSILLFCSGPRIISFVDFSIW